MSCRRNGRLHCKTNKPIDPRKLVKMIEGHLRVYNQDESTDGKDVVRGYDGEDPINLKAALLRFDNDESFMFETLNEFIDSLVEELEILESAIQSSNASVVSSEAHKIKGAAANFSAEKLVSIASELELMAKNGELSKASEMFNQIKEQRNYIDNFIKRVKQKA